MALRVASPIQCPTKPIDEDRPGAIQYYYKIVPVTSYVIELVLEFVSTPQMERLNKLKAAYLKGVLGVEIGSCIS